MHIITKQSKVPHAIKSFFKNYETYKRLSSPFYTEERYKNILSLYPATATHQDIARLMNSGWVDNSCHECGEDYEITLQLGQEPDYESSTANVCLKCLKDALALFNCK